MTITRVPDGPDAITVAWLSAALGQQVEAFELQSMEGSGGVVGRLARLRVRYEDSEAGDPHELIAKFSAEDGPFKDLCNQVGMFEREVLFYREVAPQGGSYTPTCHHAVYDPERGRSVLLLDDRPEPTAFESEDSTLLGAIRALARFHAKWWDEPRIESLGWMPGLVTDLWEATSDILVACP